MLSTDDIKDLEVTFMNAKSQEVIKGMLIFSGTIIIFYLIFY
jgi:hypothetical protein